MIHINRHGGYYFKGNWLDKQAGQAAGLAVSAAAREQSMALGVMRAHCCEGGPNLRIRFDALASHDITYAGIIQTARASGLERFPVPYVLTNCHNSLCAVGGTINEDDHIFGLSAAKKYGGEYVPAHMAVIHQYMRERHAACGGMILGSDSHSRYGALGCMGIGEGGPELVKQLLGRTYDLPMPEVAAVYLEGAPRPGVGPQDVALVLIKALFGDGLVKNRVLEFFGPGLNALSVDFRMGIDVMTTETACLSSIWRTDKKVKDWLTLHDREKAFEELQPKDGAWYDLVITLDLSTVEPMIALPFHPSNAWSIKEFLANAPDLLHAVEEDGARMLGRGAPRPQLLSKYRSGAFFADQGIIAGCSGGMYENMVRAADILQGGSTGCGAFSLSVYPASQPQYLELLRSGHAACLMQTGAVLKSAFCGPCFGAGDVPANNAFSLRHTTRNFPNREGSKPASGQLAYVALMDARSIAATALMGGRLTPATDLPEPPTEQSVPYTFDGSIYSKRVYQGFGKAVPNEALILGPNIKDWPQMPPLPENLLLVAASAIYDPVTTTDELIPSGETSSYRSNPLKLAEFTLSRKDPEYLGRARAILALELTRRGLCNAASAPAELDAALPSAAPERDLHDLFSALGLTGQEAHTGVGSLIFALRPGDGSAREQAASCQKVLGGWANIAADYATKRYRSNLVNWGLLPFILTDAANFNIAPGDRLFVPGLRQALLSGLEELPATLFQGEKSRMIRLTLPGLSREEREIILAGCLMNYYAG
ncbi:hydratase [Desulfovibrio sp. OttesenSCG-928-F20]|nr:hydratase [Desulfovibrio sp. OttesenSCG-928-F20]